MATVFWDAKCVILLDIFATGSMYQCIPYYSTLYHLRDAIRRKSSGLLGRRDALQYDNATPYSANLTEQWKQRYGWEILPHPDLHPDMRPSDFHLSGLLKRH
ncbi:histone-lysine N-methyltransferase SETMAR [Elysia marginata]|uniref:Histone-lysine N-methyltransferase SETMAR n=1 Tax=Elysia marginata TaxID=1093978 RepID=A0AAV4IBX2_9GAST|nr:histone-lysine N-methyltransferase SETMAR [Elysia marginata]